VGVGGGEGSGGGEEEKEEEEEEEEEEEDEMDVVLAELAKCYYAMFGYKLRGFRSEYDWVDNLIKSAAEDGAASGDGRRGSRVREGGDVAVGPSGKLSEALALDLWSFVEPLAAPQGCGKFQGGTPAEVRDILRAILDVLKPDPKFLVHKKDVDRYLRPFNDSLPSMSDLLPDFAAILQGLPVQGASCESAAADAGGGRGTSEQRKLECFKQIYFVVARCITLSNNEEQLKEKIEFHLLDLHVDPRRIDSWIGLADCYQQLLLTSPSFG